MDVGEAPLASRTLSGRVTDPFAFHEFLWVRQLLLRNWVFGDGSNFRINWEFLCLGFPHWNVFEKSQAEARKLCSPMMLRVWLGTGCMMQRYFNEQRQTYVSQ